MSDVGDEVTAEALHRALLLDGHVDLGHRDGGPPEVGRVPAALIADVIDRLTASPAPSRGRVVLAGLRVEGVLALGDRDLPFSMTLARCRLDDGLELPWARTRSIRITTCVLGRLDARDARIDGDLQLDDCVTGPLDLRFAQIAGHLRIDGGKVSAGQEPFALDATGLSASGSVQLSGVRIEGAVELVAATSGRLLVLNDSHVSNPGGMALDASRVRVDGPVFARQFSAQGGVSLRRAEVQGFIDFEDATITEVDRTALFAPGLRADGGLYLRRAEFDGGVFLLEARVGTSCSFEGATIRARHGPGIDGSRMTVDGPLFMSNGMTVDGGPIDLRRARVALLRTDSGELPPARLEGLTVEDVQPAPTPAQATRWIRSVDAGYSPQPYEQFAALYRRLGHDDDARVVLRAKQRHRRTGFAWPAKLWGVAQDVLVGYGYRPGQAAAWLLALLVVGTVTFSVDRPSPTGRGPAFNALVYSWDLLVPVGDYGQQQSFSPSGASLWMSYFLISAGWLLATACLAAVTRALART